MLAMTSGDRRIAAVATGQLGVFSRAQAHDAGLSDRQLRRRVQSGTLVQTGPNGFRYAGSPETLMTELHALVHDVGEPVFVSGPTAAALHGFDGFRLRRPYHLLVPASRHLTRASTRLHRTDTIEPIDRCTVDGLPVTSAVRTLIELARVLDGIRLTACLDSALRDGLVSESLVHRRIAALRGSGRYGLPALLRALVGETVTRGGHSWLEREYLRLIHDAGLPRPDTQVVLSKAGDELVRVDCRFPGSRVVVELLGYRFHRSRAQMNKDAERINALHGDGFHVYQFTYEHVTLRGEQVVEVTRRALRRA
jgi:hypothetical protein